MSKLRILLADDHEIVRRGLCAMLEKHDGWEICGEASDGRKAVEMAKKLKPDVVILDIGMPYLNGVDTTSQLLQYNPRFKVIVLTITDSDQVIRQVLDAGARGFLLKSDAARDLVSAVEALQSNRTFFTPRVNDLVVAGFLGNGGLRTEQPNSTILTAREREVTQLLAEGKSPKEAATLLDLSTKTLETHRSNIMRKLNLHSIPALVVYAITNNIIQVQLPPTAPEATAANSCFISYSTKDQSFADRLHADLQNQGVRCWFAPHDIQGGKKLHEQIDEAIRLHDKLLLILSPHSMESVWVKTEISKARKREVRDQRRVLFPIRLSPFEALRDWECFDADTGKDSAREIREYFIPDFSNWKNHDSYQEAFQRLIADLKSPDSPASPKLN